MGAHEPEECEGENAVEVEVEEHGCACGGEDGGDWWNECGCFVKELDRLVEF
jgi:hypothetical protein